jgi:hypothetical protein
MVFKCGNLQLSREELEAVLDLNATDWPTANTIRDPKTIPLSQYHLDTGMWYMNVVQLILNQTQFSRVARNQKTTSLLFWLTTLRYANATDPRDKVYAALGLAESFNQNANSRIYDSDSLIVDYRRPIGEIYASLVKSLVTSTKRLDVLLACCSRRHVTQTWTPDWSMPTDLPGFRSALCGSSDNVLRKKRIQLLWNHKCNSLVLLRSFHDDHSRHNMGHRRNNFSLHWTRHSRRARIP